MRYDIFIIWGNALNRIPDIVSDISEDSNFHIVRLKYHLYQNRESFIKDIYKCDTVPWKHLLAKSKYLLSASNKCMVILVKNLEPREQIVGSGKFRHTQCRNVNDLKTKIRSKFNPKFKDPNKQICPLPKGVSHEHVIHGTDYESQTKYLLGYFNLGKIDYYKRYDSLDYYVPWHLNVRSSIITEKQVNLSDLKCNVLGKGLIKVKDSPHFKYVKGDKLEYQSYINKHIGKELQENHFCEAFDRLIDSYDPNYKAAGKKSLIIVNKNNVIVDGLHRASILTKLNTKQIRTIVI
tara:strand:- start:685 stop:1563 length:879 start_codon:yes stop_codon:yes gene_type:complete